MSARILLVEDEVNMARTLARNLERAGHTVTHAPHGEAALAMLANEPFDVVLTDLKMPVLDGMGLLRALHERGIATAVVVLTGYGTIESAVEAMKLGAADYLIKDARPEEVLRTIERTLRVQALERENARLRSEIGRFEGIGELVGTSEAMQAVYRLVDAVSQTKSTVLISGESGTGKELVARTIHRRSPVAQAPFVAINCAGLSETLLDSQLFGHRRGAFTGAVSDHDGVFRAAAGGTLLLDEVAEIPLSLQAKFLRAIQEREVTPLGSTRPIPVDVRLIAATNRDMDAEVRAGRFRADLFYRLNVVHIEVPPLRARREDLPALVRHFLRAACADNGLRVRTITPEAIARLAAHDFPGNVRELRNLIERLVILSPGEVIGEAEVAEALPRPGAVAAEAPQPAGRLRNTMADLERQVILAALERNAWRMAATARELGLERSHLYKKMRKLGVSPESWGT
jgi:DNA-binding NtrC family response regulator